jgi:hypothetical protein
MQLGEFVMVGLGYALPGWQHLLIACGCINAATLLLYPLVPESGRWLLSQGRTEEAKQSLARIAKANRSSMPAEPLTSSRSSKQLEAPEDLETAAHTPHEDSIAAEIASGKDAGAGTDSAGVAAAGAGIGAADAPVDLVQLLRRPRLAQRLLILLVNSFTLMLNYYGISMGAGGIPGSM